jgi:tRNA(Ile2) C34 agmatinyltransferase TiaS
MYTSSREEEVKLLKRLWTSQPTVCPKCGQATLEYLHKKAKKSDTDWKCPACREIFRTIRMLYDLPND